MVRTLRLPVLVRWVVHAILVLELLVYVLPDGVRRTLGPCQSDEECFEIWPDEYFFTLSFASMCPRKEQSRTAHFPSATRSGQAVHTLQEGQSNGRGAVAATASSQSQPPVSVLTLRLFRSCLSKGKLLCVASGISA